MKQSIRLVFGIAQLTFVEAMRSRLLLVAATVGASAVALGFVAAGASVFSRGRFIVDISLLAASFVGHIVACTMSTGLLSGETHKHSEYMLLCRPLSRAQFLLGRLLGISWVLTVLSQSIGALMVCGLLAVRAPVTHAALLAGAMVPIEVFVTASIGALFAAASSRALATTMTVMAFLAGQVADDVNLLAERKEQFPISHLLRFGYHLLPDFSRLTLRDVAAADAPSLALAASVATYAVCYISVVTALACIVYERRATRLS